MSFCKGAVMQNNFLAISQQLLNLSGDILGEVERIDFLTTVNKLYLSLANGSSCLELTEDNSAATIKLLIKSNLAVAYIGQLPTELQPLPLSIWQVNGRVYLYLTRYLSYEYRIYASIQQLLAHQVVQPNNFMMIVDTLKNLQQRNNLPNQEQFDAIIKSCQVRFNLITGGPGTGKTTTVMLLLWALYQLYGSKLKVKICAPTGKAAIRVRDSMSATLNYFKQDVQDGLDVACFTDLMSDSANFGTVHKLLGTQNNSIYFRHNHNKQLDVDVLIVDESSMIGLPLFSKLLDAIDYSKIKHVIFLGDQNQLSSVEEGYVFASLVNLQIEQENCSPKDLLDFMRYRTLASDLRISNRNNAKITTIAAAVLAGDSRLLLHRLAQYDLLKPLIMQELLQSILHNEYGVINYLHRIQQNLTSYSADEVKQLFAQFNQQSNLCATNNGFFGAVNLNQELEKLIKLQFSLKDEWYSGRPIMILQNDYSLDLFNGDIGICMIIDKQIKVLFENGKSFIPEILPKYSLAYAITIHKSQGSEYQSVNVILSKASTSASAMLLSMELLYTAITRAKTVVNIFTDKDVLVRALENKVTRSSGLIAMFGFMGNQIIAAD